MITGITAAIPPVRGAYVFEDIVFGLEDQHDVDEHR
jgi:hypothetical protein